MFATLIFHPRHTGLDPSAGCEITATSTTTTASLVRRRLGERKEGDIRQSRLATLLQNAERAQRGHVEKERERDEKVLIRTGRCIGFSSLSRLYGLLRHRFFFSMLPYGHGPGLIATKDLLYLLPVYSILQVYHLNPLVRTSKAYQRHAQPKDSLNQVLKQTLCIAIRPGKPGAVPQYAAAFVLLLRCH